MNASRAEFREKCVATLPINPSKIQPLLGFYCTPVISDIFSRLTGKPLLLAMNVIGRKSFNVQEAIPPYLENLGKLRVSPVKVWRDDDKKHLFSLSEYAELLYSKGWITETRRAVKICHCGALEMLAYDLGGRADFKVLRSGNDQQDDSCKLCKTRVNCLEKNVLLLNAKPRKSITIYPRCLQVEFDRYLKQIASHELLISRIRPENPSIVLQGREYFLDIDFAWSMYLKNLFDTGFLTDTVVCSNHVLARLALVYSVNCGLLEHDPVSEAVITPYYDIDLGLDIMQKFGHQAVRGFLLSMFHPRHKEVRGKSRDLFLLHKSFEAYSAEMDLEQGKMSTEQAYDLMQGHEVLKLAKILRQQISLGKDYLALLKAIQA